MYPEYSPIASEYDYLTASWVDLYEIDSLPWNDGEGESAMFFLNGASVDEEDEFALKIFKHGSRGEREAKASWERQKFAYYKDLAPPVGRLVKVMTDGDIYWGYQTCVAANGDEEAMIEAHQQAIHEWDELYAEVDEAVDTLNRLGCSVDDAVDLTMEAWENRGYGSCDPNDLHHHEWYHDYGGADYCYENDIDVESVDLNDLRWRLKNVDIRFALGEDNPNKKPTTPRTLGGDVWPQNVGLWKGEPVCIDFGWHSVQGAW